MIKLKEIDTSNRGAFVIDWNGKIHDVHFHGDALYEPGFEKLMAKAQALVGNNPDVLVSMIQDPNEKLLSIFDNAGCIRGGVWSQSFRQLYFTINKSKATYKAKDAAVNKIIKYKPSSIYLEDLENYNNDGFMPADEFAGEYL